MQLISADKPYLCLKINEKIFKGLVDIGADMSVISQNQWPNAWPTQETSTPVKGVGIINTPRISSNQLYWETEDGHSGRFCPFVLPIDLNLWGRDVLTEMGLVLETKNFLFLNNRKLFLL